MKEADKAALEASARLDRLVLCSRCNGQGMYKKQYNFQVRDVNCEICDSEGLLYRADDGQLVLKKFAPVQGNQQKEFTGMTDDIAMDLARNCGVNKNDDDPLKLREGDVDLDLPPPF